jgi:hypothetical protein
MTGSRSSMAGITCEQLDRISTFTHKDRLRALVIINQFFWENLTRTYRNSADLITLNGEQAQLLIQNLEAQWNNEEFASRQL